jgi:proline iminopeptidase
MPVVICHGGPGSALNQSRRRFYDPASWRIVMFDQRGCGKSAHTYFLLGHLAIHI